MTAILVLVLGCGPEKEPDERSVSPIGSPFEMNTSDTVIDNPDLIPGNLYGEIELTGSLPAWGGATCDSTFTVTGTPYTGYCPGCTFNFQVVSHATREEGLNCPSEEDMAGFWSRSVMTFQFWYWQYQIVLQYGPYVTGGGFYGGYITNEPALKWGVNYYPDPIVFPVAYKGSALGTITNATATTIDWTMDWSYYYYGLNELHAVGHVYIVQ